MDKLIRYLEVPGNRDKVALRLGVFCIAGSVVLSAILLIDKLTR